MSDDDNAAERLVAEAWKRRQRRLTEFYIANRGMDREAAERRATTEIEKMHQRRFPSEESDESR